MKKKVKSKFKVNELVYCRGQGVGTIQKRKKLKFDFSWEEFYQVSFEKKEYKVGVPVRLENNMEIRELISTEDAESLLKSLQDGLPARKLKGPWHKQVKELNSLLNSSNPRDLIDVIKALTIKVKNAKITFEENKILKKAKHLVASEIAYVKGENAPFIESKIDEILLVNINN